MRILFLGGVFTPENKQEIVNNSKGVIQYAANSLQWSFIKGFDNFYQTDIISLPFVGSYPFRFKKTSLSSFCFEHTTGAKDVNIGFTNLPVIKLLFRYYKAKKELLKYLSNTPELTTIIIYSVHSPFLKSAAESKKAFPKTKICLIAPDLPEYMSDSKNIFYRILKKIDLLIIKKALKEVDSFVLLSDNMVREFKINNRPWVRIEGIFDPSETCNPVIKEKNKTILYTGTLAHHYGIMNLIEAFINIKSDNYRLWICGEGDSRKAIEKIALQDRRILYLGQRTHEEVLVLQKKATVLVNPRTSEGDYTKYSFPSKTMEYFASGTPAILNRLQGIPDEYFQYCFVLENEEISCLTEMILYVCEKDQKELDEIGRKASFFIKEFKNPISQVGKIYKMLNPNDSIDFRLKQPNDQVVNKIENRLASPSKTLLQINSVTNFGSTGRGCEDLSQFVIKKGWNSYIAYGRNIGIGRSRPGSNLIKIGNVLDILFHGLQTRFFDRHGLASRGSTKKLIAQLRIIKPDIVHLHNLHGYHINIKILINYLIEANIPVVWTFHDCWPMTGHCCHFDFVGCEKWKTKCYKCPQKKNISSQLGTRSFKKEFSN